MNRSAAFTCFIVIILFTGVVCPLRADAPSPHNKTSTLARLKQRHYHSIGVHILPDTLGDTTIGPGIFVATGDIVIERGRTAALAGRTTLMFEPGRRLYVNGTLLAHNTSAGKIRLSHTPLAKRANKIPIADSLWGGIVLLPGSSVMLNHTIFSEASIGITIGDGVRQVDLACVNMSKGVTAPLFTGNKPVEVEDVNCISTADLPRKPPVSSSPLARTTSQKASSPALSSKALRIGSCILTAGGLGAGVYGAYRYRKYGQRYQEADDPLHNSSSQVDRYKEKAEKGGWIGIAGGIVSVIGSTLLTLTLTF